MNFAYVVTPSQTADCHAKLTTSVIISNKKKSRENVRFSMEIGPFQVDRPISWPVNKVMSRVKNTPKLKLLVQNDTKVIFHEFLYPKVF